MDSSESPQSENGADVAWAIEQGAREHQQDAVRTSVGDDGSWMIAVADGTGGGINANHAAPAAVGALPDRIASDEEMIEAFAAANRAVREFGPDSSKEAMDEDLSAGWAADPDTTLVVAAWTPEGGLVIGWIGDSVAIIAPSEGHGWASKYQQMEHGAPIIGEFAGVGVSDSLRNTIVLLSQEQPREEVDKMLSAGATVAVMSDGAWGMYETDHDLFTRHGYPCEWGDEFKAERIAAEDAAMQHLLPVDHRDNASRAVAHILQRVTDHPGGMYDNTAVAVVRVTAP